MAVIAMTREIGTLGQDIAQGVASSLALRVIHHEFVEHDLAQRLGVQESIVHRYLEGSGSLLERWQIDKKKLSRYTAQEVLEVAQKGDAIIRGWGATALLRDIPHVLRVRVCAPMAFRERVMMERLGIKEAVAARREIELNDAAHARIMHGFLGADWGNSLLYHVVLNTGVVSVQACVRLLRRLTEDPAFQETEATRSALGDSVLVARIRAALSEKHALATDTSTIEATATNGKVTLTGKAIHLRLSSDVEQTVRAVNGVMDVENRIVVVGSYGGAGRNHR